MRELNSRPYAQTESADLWLGGGYSVGHFRFGAFGAARSVRYLVRAST